MSIDISKCNQQAWDKEAKNQNQWSQIVSEQIIEQAKQGNWTVALMPEALPEGWIPKNVKGLRILCLASGGGQQAPIFSAAGADVTVFDNSPEQLALDEQVAQRDNLSLKTVLGDMRDLSCFEKETFDLVFHPISNLYVPEIKIVWKEAHRVLKEGGILLSSFYNPIVFVFDKDPKYRKEGLLKPIYQLPYSDLTSLSPEKLNEKIENKEAICFGHSLTDQINGQIEAGFLISGFYENHHPNERFLIDHYVPTFIATKAIKKSRVSTEK